MTEFQYYEDSVGGEYSIPTNQKCSKCDGFVKEKCILFETKLKCREYLEDEGWDVDF